MECEECKECKFAYKCNIKKLKEREKIFNENTINTELVKELFQVRYNL